MNKIKVGFVWVGDLFWFIILTFILLVYGLVPFIILPVVVLIDHIVFRFKIRELMAIGIPKEAILKEYNHKYWEKLKVNYRDTWNNYKKIFTEMIPHE